MNETYKIRAWGGSLAVILPRHVVRVMELESGDEVAIQHETLGRKRGVITIKPVPTKPLAKGKSK